MLKWRDLPLKNCEYPKLISKLCAFFPIIQRTTASNALTVDVAPLFFSKPIQNAYINNESGSLLRNRAISSRNRHYEYVTNKTEKNVCLSLSIIIYEQLYFCDFFACKKFKVHIFMLIISENATTDNCTNLYV